MFRTFVGQRIDDVTKRGQRQVDGLGLLHTLALDTCLLNSLGTGKIDQIDFTSSLRKVYYIFLLDLQNEYRMRTG